MATPSHCWPGPHHPSALVPSHVLDEVLLTKQEFVPLLFPWPQQPHQQYDENMERVACQRRCSADDAWVNPHNLYLMMFSPSTIHVLPFDPYHGSDSARFYASKYTAKAEKWYYLETLKDAVRAWLQCRTFGICMCHNRLLGFHVVRSTRPVCWTATEFIPERPSRTPRPAWHIEQNPDYPG